MADENMSFAFVEFMWVVQTGISRLSSGNSGDMAKFCVGVSLRCRSITTQPALAAIEVTLWVGNTTEWTDLTLNQASVMADHSWLIQHSWVNQSSLPKPFVYLVCPDNIKHLLYKNKVGISCCDPMYCTCMYTCLLNVFITGLCFNIVKLEQTWPAVHDGHFQWNIFFIQLD